jgi:phosphatidylethanolamine/phosphatidyl-N-methylethanolamine N-methyltransferase
MSEHLHFLKAALRNAGGVGAVAPSSAELAALMTDWLDWGSLSCVVEFGPGTGVFTERIASLLAPDCQFFAVERDPGLAAVTRARCPGVEIREECASRLPETCRERGIASIDAVISGLPWAAFPAELQERLLGAMLEMLPPGGRFATFAYWQGLALPAGRRFRRLLEANFSSVERSPTSWRNLPPAFVYRCVR